MRLNTIGRWWLVVVLGASACASLPAKQKAVQVVRTTETVLGAAQDFERANHAAVGLDTPASAAQLASCPGSTVVLPPNASKHQVVSCLFALAFTSQAASATALQSWKAGDPQPSALGELQRELDALMGIVKGVSSNTNQQQLVTELQQVADGVLSAVRAIGGR